MRNRGYEQIFVFHIFRITHRVVLLQTTGLANPRIDSFSHFTSRISASKRKICGATARFSPAAFFQIGTTRFISSISHWHAANASPDAARRLPPTTKVRRLLPRPADAPAARIPPATASPFRQKANGTDVPPCAGRTRIRWRVIAVPSSFPRTMPVKYTAAPMPSDCVRPEISAASSIGSVVMVSWRFMAKFTRPAPAEKARLHRPA